MDSRSSRPTQPDNGQQGSFRVKLRVTQVAFIAYGMMAHSIRPIRMPVYEARVWARLGDAFAAKALQRAGLEP